MNIKTTALILFSSLVASPVFAMDYPQFGGITLNSDTTAAQYIIYFFNLALAMGALIAVIMVISAGIEWVTSGGNPSKVQSAKGKIMNTLFGVCVLLGCYFILDTINPELTNIKISDLTCENGIVLSVLQASDGKVKDKCIDSDIKSIEDTITSTKNWNFPDGYLLKVYAYTEADYKGTITEFNCGTGACGGSIPTGTKSIHFVHNTPGIYLYDANNYVPGVKSYPRFTAESVADLTQLNSFDNYTQSLAIVNPDQAKQKIQYQAVIFEDQNWRGRCSIIRQSIPSLSQGGSSYQTDNIQNVSSIIVAKSNLDQSAINADRGKVILYTKRNCGKASGLFATQEIKSCSISIESSVSVQYDIFAKCGGAGSNAFKPGDEVQSFEITGAAGIVLSTAKPDAGTDKTRCQYFSKKDLNGGTCLSIVDTSVYSVYTVGGETPKSLVIIPDN